MSDQINNDQSKPVIQPRSTSILSNLPSETEGVLKVKNSIKNNLSIVAEVESGGTLSPESKAILDRFVDNSSRGFVSVIPMICKGIKCPYLSACPLHAAGSKLPIDKSCPVENTIAAIQVSKHLQALNIEDVNDPSHSFDLDMLCEMAGLELLRWRCGAELSKDSKVIITQMVGATLEGEPLFEDVPNPVIDVLERTSRHIAKLREALVATRKAQLEAGQDIHDVSSKAADLRARAEIAKKKRLEQIKNADFKVT